MNRLVLSLRTLIYGAVFLGFWGWLSLQFRDLDPVLGLTLSPGVRTAGRILMVAAGSFVLEGDGTPAPFDPPREFVAVGLYRWVRNPMYVGGMLLLAGFGLWHHSGAMLLFSLCWAGLAHLFVRFYEEPRLEAEFGDRYRRYLRGVNRWVPVLRNPSRKGRLQATAGALGEARIQPWLCVRMATAPTRPLPPKRELTSAGRRSSMEATLESGI